MVYGLWFGVCWESTPAGDQSCEHSLGSLDETDVWESFTELTISRQVLGGLDETDVLELVEHRYLFDPENPYGEDDDESPDDELYDGEEVMDEGGV